MGSDPENFDLYLVVIEVSIHAPTWGATPISLSFEADGMFQSTLPHGERPMAAIATP